jgi:hypothetical protein
MMKAKRKTFLVLGGVLLFSAAFAARAQEPKQVNVAVKIIEFQSTEDLETGFSAYFKNRLDPRPYGRVVAGQESAVDSLALTFPSPTTSGLTVFLDNLTNNWADVELVLQAMVDQGKAFILSQPKVMVPVGAAVPAIIKTSQDVPYENTIVIGASAVQTTAFKMTGVILTVSALEVVDDDANPTTTDDIYVKLKLTAEISEEGQRIAVALDQRTGSGGILNAVSTSISVPEFVSRSVDTTVWVRNGQVLLLGGLYRNNKTTVLSTMPWLPQTEGVVNNLISRVLPFAANPQVPLSASVGYNNKGFTRRELVFMIKADLWRKSFTVADEFGFAADQVEGKDGEKTPEDAAKSKTPADVITGVLGGNGGIAQGLAGSIGARPGNAISGGKSK